MQDARDRDVVDAKDPVDGHVMAGSGSQQMAYLLRSEPITLLQLMMRPKSSLDWCFLAQCLNGAVEVPVPARGALCRNWDIFFRPVSALGAPYWHGDDLGTDTSQCQHWTPSAGTGPVPKWGLTYILAKKSARTILVKIPTAADTLYLTNSEALQL